MSARPSAPSPRRIRHAVDTLAQLGPDALAALIERLDAISPDPDIEPDADAEEGGNAEPDSDTEPDDKWPDLVPRDCCEVPF